MQQIVSQGELIIKPKRLFSGGPQEGLLNTPHIIITSGASAFIVRAKNVSVRDFH